MQGFLSRQSVGRLADARANNQDLKDKAASGNKWARLQLAAARKTSGSSFDFRATKAGNATVGSLGAGKAGGKGGFNKYKEEKAKDAAKFAQSLAPGDEVIDQAEQGVKRAEEIDHTTDQFKQEHREVFLAQSRIAREKQEELSRAKEKYAEYAGSVSGGLTKADPNLIEKYRKEIETKEKEAAEAEIKRTAINTREGYKNSKVEEAQSKLDSLKGVDDKRAKEIIREKMQKEGKTEREINETIGNKANVEAIKQQNKSAGERRKQEYARSVERSVWAKAFGYNKAAAAQIRKGKSDKDKLADAAKALIKAEEDKGDDEEGKKPKDEGGGEPAPEAKKT
jgi:hypothetical protein